LAEHVSRNSEGYVMALGVAAWIEFVRPALGSVRRTTGVTSAAAVAALAVGVFLLRGPVPGVVGTLNEAFFALAVLVGWLELPRPVPAVAWLLPVGSFLVACLLSSHPAVVAAAEYLAAYVLFPVGLDLVDPGILQARVPTRLPLVLGWMAVLVVLAVTVHVLAPDPLPDGVADVIRYLSRINETVIAVLLVHLYLTVLGMAPARRRPPDRVGVPA
jgi:hypothetical protein